MNIGNGIGTYFIGTAKQCQIGIGSGKGKDVKDDSRNKGQSDYRTHAFSKLIVIILSEEFTCNYAYS